MYVIMAVDLDISGKYKVAVARFPVQKKAGKTETIQKESENQRRRFSVFIHI